MPSKRSSINSKVRSQSNIHSARISRSRVAAQSLHDLRDGDEDIWFSESELYKHHIMEIRNKWQTLDDSIWAKIICLEGNRRVAKAYARAPAICIDGSDLAFDGETIGLGGFDNPHRDSATRSAIRTIRKGILLTIDEKGNIWVERRSHCNVYTPDWTKDPNKTCLDRELIASRGVLPRKCKVFDMSKFLENLIHELDNAYPDIQPLESQSIVNLTFNYKGNFLLESPISLLVINMVALQILRKRFPPIEGPQQEQKLLGKFKLRAKKICEKLGIGSKHSRNLSRSWALDSSQPWKNSDKNGSTYQSYVDNYLPVPFRESRENRENLGMISRSEPPTSAKYSSIDGYSTFNRNFNNNIERSSKNFFNSTYNRGFTMDSRAKIYVPDPDYDSSSSELPSLSDLPPIVKNSHGNRKSLDVIPKSNNRGNDSDWDGIPVKNEYVGRSKSKSQSLGPLNSCLRIMPINASLAPKEEQEEITLNSVCEEKMHNNQTLATSNSSASIQSSPDADTHIYSSIHDSKESKSSLESNSSNESPPAFE